MQLNIRQPMMTPISMAGMSKDISDNLSALNTILQIVTSNIGIEDIATKGIAIAIYCNHPSKIKLAAIGAQTYPKSTVMLSAVSSIKDEIKSPK